MDEEKDALLNFSFEWESLRGCPLCGNKVMIPNGRVEWLGMQFWYVVCPRCGLKYMNPRPTQSSYREFYKNYFWQQKVRNVGFRKEGQMWGVLKYKWDNEKKWDPEAGRVNKMEKLKALRVETITKALQSRIRLDEKTHVLEVGSGFPVTLNELRRQFGCAVYAIEPSQEAQDEIKKSQNVAFLGEYGEDLEEISKSGRRFDAIIFSHSLENTSVPFDILGYARDALREGGVIYVQCSNLQTFDQMNPYHPYIFSESAFVYTAEKLKLQYERLSEPTDRMLTSLFYT